MSMSDELMILTIEKMQIELRRAMEDIELLTIEIQRRVQPVAPEEAKTTPLHLTKVKRVIKIRKTPAEEPKKKPTGIVTWNAYLTQTRNEMQKASDVKMRNEDVVAKATATKLADPEGYKVFCSNWLLNHYKD